MNYLSDDSFWVCEKSDGIRVLVLVLFNKEAGKQDVFMVREHGTILTVARPKGTILPNRGRAFSALGGYSPAT